ncbi:MAG: sugar ABC transporter substrate-binding protein [Leucobacter sp.]
MNKTARALGVAAAALSLVILVGCSGSDPAPSGSAASTAELSPQAQAAAEVVAAHTGAVDEFTAPGPAVDGAALAGKTVYFIPATLQAPLLNSIGDSVTTALGNVDVTVQVCDAKLNPADIASCIGQAVDADAAAVITAGLVPEFASAAFEQLATEGIPWVQGITTSAGEGAPTEIAYVTADNVLLQSWATNWVIADSDAKAKALVVKLTDSPATTTWADRGILAVYEEDCTECVVEVIETNSGQFDKLPSLISSALVSNPEITYIQAQFEQLLPAVSQGIQAAARDDITVVSVDGSLAALQDIQSGGGVGASIGYNTDALAWYMADAAIRLATGEEAIQNLDLPFRRIFDAGNVGTLSLTPEAQARGEWFGSADYQGGLLELWGVN